MPVRHTTRETGLLTVTDVPDPSVTVEVLVGEEEGLGVVPPQAARARTVEATRVAVRTRRRGRFAVNTDTRVPSDYENDSHVIL
jgi:hypothetical protein